jgi:hypothetical protein
VKTATAFLLAVCLSTACATFPLSALGGHLTPQFAWLALLAGIAGAAFYLARPGPSAQPLPLQWPEWLAIALFSLFALRAFCWLVFLNGDSLCVLSPNNLGDLPLHLTYIRYIARGAPFWPENPIYSGIPLHYPAGIDIFNALLSLAGCDDFRALIWVALACSAVTCYALLRWGRWFAASAFLCNGGLAGWKFFHHAAFRIEDFQQSMAWKSIPLSMFVTQRGLLYAIPAGLLLLATWRAQWFSPIDKDGKSHPALSMPIWVQVALYSTMPLFHLHTFLFLSALLAYWFIIGRKGLRLRYHILDLLLWAILPATVSVSLVTGLFQRGQSAAHVIHHNPHWTPWMQDGKPAFPFWFQNFGFLPYILLFLILWAILRHRQAPTRDTAPAWLYFVLPSLAIFIVTCFIMFAPWEWDNMKLMIWSYIAILPFIHETLLLFPSTQGLALRILCYTLLLFSGFISLIGGLDGTHTGYEIAKPSELDSISYAVRNIPPDATFAGWPTYNHPLLLCGCKMAEGYAGHLFSHGINYQPRDAALTRMMNGDRGWQSIATSLHIQYLFWGYREAAAYPDSTQPWKSLPILASGPWGTIYDISNP